ncbi:MAG: acetolactate synthase small subunit [Acidobacteriota bacterium]
MNQHDAPRPILTVLLMEDRPDALAHLVGLLHRRAFQIGTLSSGVSERPGVLRLTLGMTVEPAEAERLARELRRSMHVLAVECLDGAPEVHRELLLVKVAIDAARRTDVLQLAEVFRAHVIDIAPESVSLELTGDQDKLDALMRLLAPFDVLESARSGPVAMGRGADALAAHEQSTSWLDRHEAKRHPPPASEPTNRPTLSVVPQPDPSTLDSTSRSTASPPQE